jgi:hypothetical protein
VSALYEQGRVHHLGVFGPLEDQMTSYDGSRTGSSPDRLDALVWGVTELLLGEPAGGFIRETALLPRPRAGAAVREPIEVPAIIDGVFAVAAAAIGPEPDAVGVIYFGFCALIEEHPPLFILDWDLEQIDIETLQRWLPKVYARLDELAKPGKTIFGSGGLLIEAEGAGSVLFERAMMLDLRVHTIDDEKILNMNIAQRAVAASAYVNGGHVQLTRPAHEKLQSYKGALKNHLVHQVVAFGVGQQPSDAGVLLAAFADGVLDAFLSEPLRARAA